jgi:hypothetical protein
MAAVGDGGDHGREGDFGKEVRWPPQQSVPSPPATSAGAAAPM